MERMRGKRRWLASVVSKAMSCLAAARAVKRFNVMRLDLRDALLLGDHKDLDFSGRAPGRLVEKPFISDPYVALAGVVKNMFNESVTTHC